MTRQQQTGSSHHRGARSVFTALATAAALSLFGGYAGAEHAGLNGAGGPTVDPAIEPYTNHNGLQGKLSIAGSDTMRPLISKLSAQFLSLHPGAQIAVEGTGSSAAIREFLLGLSYQRRGDKVQSRGTAGSNAVELLASSRQLTEEEQKGFEFNYGYRPLEVPIAMDAVAIYVHKNNPIQRLTLAQIDGIFGKDHKRGQAAISNWSQVGLLESSLAQQPIHLYGRDKRSGTREFFKHVALKDGDLVDTVVEQPGSASEIIAIAQDPLAVGYAGAGFNISDVRQVPIASQPDQSALLPSVDTVTSGTYPLGRSLYLYVKKNPNDKLDPFVAEFLSFVNSRQGQETVARASFYPLTGAQVAKNLQDLGLLKGAMVGTPTKNQELQFAEQVSR
ncbi:MAG: PstS family phosphate ABC transporter substrate-binding protein [Nitrospira sp.]|nr:PstS family phosphate ABC transporter substrate-binding protein [Nitrospira sp.]